jgi:hypothetical protein
MFGGLPTDFGHHLLQSHQILTELMKTKKTRRYRIQKQKMPTLSALTYFRLSMTRLSATIPEML